MTEDPSPAQMVASLEEAEDLIQPGLDLRGGPPERQGVVDYLIFDSVRSR